MKHEQTMILGLKVFKHCRNHLVLTVALNAFHYTKISKVIGPLNKESDMPIPIALHLAK
jgi:hypothetical protein